jgi:hypothetical protein
MDNLESSNCNELRHELNRCLNNNILSVKLFAKFKKECIQKNTAKNDSRKYCSTLFSNNDKFSNIKVK